MCTMDLMVGYVYEHVCEHNNNAVSHKCELHLVGCCALFVWTYGSADGVRFNTYETNSARLCQAYLFDTIATTSTASCWMLSTSWRDEHDRSETQQHRGRASIDSSIMVAMGQPCSVMKASIRFLSVSIYFEGKNRCMSSHRS
mmetsp:Transcript_21080/g.60157  ORF Transcript_21080/g.60157 Transcript_21080/m.60157 type:complete len:143 (+) Transcript_21080:802-1230(+)